MASFLAMLFTISILAIDLLYTIIDIQTLILSTAKILLIISMPGIARQKYCKKTSIPEVCTAYITIIAS